MKVAYSQVTGELTWFKQFCGNNSECVTFWDEMMEVFHLFMLDNIHVFASVGACAVWQWRGLTKHAKTNCSDRFWRLEMTRMPCESDRCTHCCHTEGACSDRYGQSSQHSLVNTSRYTRCPCQSLCRQKYVSLPVLSQNTRWHQCWVCPLILIGSAQISSRKQHFIAVQFSFTCIKHLLQSEQVRVPKKNRGRGPHSMYANLLVIVCCHWRSKTGRVRGLCAAMESVSPVDAEERVLKASRRLTDGKRRWKHATMSGCIL